MSKWVRAPRETGEHHFFVGSRGRVAIADNSIQKMSDPSSTDEGLIVLDRLLPVQVDIEYITIPVVLPAKDRRGVVIEQIRYALTLVPFLVFHGVSIEFSPFTRGFAKMVYGEIHKNDETQ